MEGALSVNGKVAASKPCERHRGASEATLSEAGAVEAGTVGRYYAWDGVTG
ncbi:MAG: hypothetical protein JWN85_4790 [Gammaproteobacteria bacterium]|nr:hypothetical protein [Gammaproteobacteria bacterium]